MTALPPNQRPDWEAIRLRTIHVLAFVAIFCLVVIVVLLVAAILSAGEQP